MSSNQHNKLTNRFFVEERFEAEAQDAVRGTGAEEARAWLRHPCTQAVINDIQANMCNIINSWLDGGYAAGTNIDATAQFQAHARGKALANEDVLQLIDDIGNGQYTEKENKSD